ncbi:MAG: DUF2630 family protein [Acidimicrobiales bacterium]
MADEAILARINELVDEENELRKGDHVEVHERLVHVEETLDQLWDLLRQRRALREFGKDPADAEVRTVEVVEHYRQ